MNMKNPILFKVVLIAASLPLLAGCIVERHPRRVVVVEQPAPVGEVIVEQAQTPPPPQVEVVPVVAPGPAYIWVKGGWEWRDRWVWEPGRWAAGPHPHAIWVVSHWEHRPHGYAWVRGHWH
jgi:WXXGXW repeat (2 copies)